MKPKKDYMEKSRERLSAWIYDYVSKKEKENPQYGVAHFAKEVDAMLKVFFQCEDSCPFRLLQPLSPFP